jgi:hypothetical protein
MTQDPTVLADQWVDFEVIRTKVQFQLRSLERAIQDAGIRIVQSEDAMEDADRRMIESGSAISSVAKRELLEEARKVLHTARGILRNARGKFVIAEQVIQEAYRLTNSPYMPLPGSMMITPLGLVGGAEELLDGWFGRVRNLDQCLK